MTLKRYQPARKRKRSSKKNRPLKFALAIGVVGVAAGLAYVSLHGEMLMGLLDGSVDLPDHHFKHVKGQLASVKAAPAVHATPMAEPHVLASASPESLKVASASAQPLKAPSPAASVAPLQKAADPKPSAFPEHGQAKNDDPVAEASPLKAAAEASPQPTPKPVLKTAVKPVAPYPKASPKAQPKPSPVVAAKAPAKPSPKPVEQAKAKPSPKPVAVAATGRKATGPGGAPSPKPVAPKPVAASSGSQRVGSLYFDKNSSYLSSAEKDRLARLIGSLKQHGGTIHVSGFADALGDAGYNRWMAQRRAGRVAELIRSQTGGKVNVVVDAVGSVGNATGADGERQNRRVEVEVR